VRSDPRRGRVWARQTLAALPYLPRVGRWTVLGGALLLSAGLLWASTSESWGTGPALSSLRLAAVALCAAAVFTLDDPAADTTAASPLPLRHRRAASGALAAATVVGMWLLLMRLASRSSQRGRTVRASLGCGDR
jgi:drug/metabolite transporter (DMT)-like permease